MRRERGSRREAGIVRRIVLVCIGWYLGAAFAIEGVELLGVTRSVSSTMGSHIDALVAQTLPALSRAVWNLDDEQIGLILSGMANDPAIGRLELHDERGRLLGRIEAQGPPGPAEAASPDGPSALPLSARGTWLGPPHSYQVGFQAPSRARTALGELEVWPSLLSARDRIRQSIGLGLARIAAIVVLLSLILFVAIERYLGKPLRSLARQIASVDASAPGSAELSPPRAGAELELVARAFNSMAERIEGGMAALRESERRLWSTFEDSPISIWDEDFSALKLRLEEERRLGVRDWEAFFAEGDRVLECNALVRVRDVNRSTLRLLGLADKGALLEGLPPLYTASQIELMRREFVAFASGASSYEGESDYVSADGRTLAIQIKVSIVPGSESTWDRVLASVIDISEQKRAERVLVESLREKELLLREVHHRVKNNLQIVCSLLSLQRGEEEQGSAIAASLIAVENRVWSMSLVHELLYGEGNLASLDFRSYASQLCEHLLGSSALSPNSVAFDIEMEDSLRLPLERAVPLGLILNELVSNALKHGFRGGRRGRVRISLRRLPAARLLLLVEDDGPGLPPQPEAGTRRGIGLGLVAGLAAQLGGSYSLESGPGLRALVSFGAEAEPRRPRA